MRKGQLNRKGSVESTHKVHRPATTTRNTATQWSRREFFAKGSVESTHKFFCERVSCIDTQGTDQPLPQETLPRSGRVTRWTTTPVRIFKDPAPPPSRPRYISRVCPSRVSPCALKLMAGAARDMVVASARTTAAEIAARWRVCVPAPPGVFLPVSQMTTNIVGSAPDVGVRARWRRSRARHPIAGQAAGAGTSVNFQFAPASHSADPIA